MLIRRRFSERCASASEGGADGGDAGAVANRAHWYCGKFDLLAEIDGVTWLLD